MTSEREQADPSISGTTERLAEAAAQAAACTACSLHENRTQCVYGTGHPAARLMWVGEAPGPDEDASGEPFTGRSGKLLTRIIEAMGLQRSHVFLANVAQCRLDENRSLTLAQVNSCRPHLDSQIRLVQPEVIIPLGSTAWRWFQPKDRRKMADVRGNIYRWRGILLAPTYHPAFLLRREEFKREVWQDVQRARELLNGTVPTNTIELGDEERSGNRTLFETATLWADEAERQTGGGQEPAA